MGRNAVLWIRDGVLIERMHLNAVAFAVAAWFCANEKTRAEFCLEDLINFAFEKSGVSCSEKLSLLCEIHPDSMCLDVGRGTEVYNTLATCAGALCEYFNGAPELLEALLSAGNDNFITSAVEQEILDSWHGSAQGRVIGRYLMYILGRRPNFNKGRDHFQFVAHELGYEKIFMIADAQAEIRASRENANAYNITTIGFANEVTVSDVLHAFDMVKDVLAAHGAQPEETVTAGAELRDSILSQQLRPERILLPGGVELEDALKRAGADKVVCGTRNSIINNLRDCLQELGLMSHAL